MTLPTDQEWMQLEKFLGMTAEEAVKRHPGRPEVFWVLGAVR